MNKLAIGGIIGILVVGAIAIYFVNQNNATQDSTNAVEDTETVITRPAVQAVPNTFSIMTPEEKAAADQAARLQAELDAQASSSASSTASTTELELELDAELDTDTEVN